ncbi:MAG TPA: hypothetical protein VF669_11080 [Tepidisphaeraceae bacterium]|jgi:RNA polymerase sigma-70 factor (ECF subfamily)
MSEEVRQSFPTTHWSLVSRAGNDDADVRRAALEDLLRRYLEPLRRHLVARLSVAPDRAEDLLQDFISDKMLAQQLISRAQRERGRFRSFLLTSLQNFALNQLRQENARQRQMPQVSLDDAAPAAARGHDPATEFEVAWARQLLQEAVEQVRRECSASNRVEVWDVFQCRVLTPILEGTKPPSYEELVARKSLKSAESAANLLVTAKRMFVRTLRCIVGQYELGEEAIDAEIADLREILSRASAH